MEGVREALGKKNSTSSAALAALLPATWSVALALIAAAN